MNSPINKYLHQNCTLQIAQRNDKGNIIFDKYGEPVYLDAKIIKCRKEKSTKNVLTTNGTTLTSATIYYVSNTISVNTNDKIDNLVILTVEEYVNSTGIVVGYKCYV